MLCGIDGGVSPLPNPEPDVQVSKHPVLQLSLNYLRAFCSSLFSMVGGAQHLDVV